MRLSICVATMQPPSLKYPGDIKSFIDMASNDNIRVNVRHNKEGDNLGVVGSYQWIYERDTTSDVLCFVHDDVVMKEPNWDLRTLKEFEDPNVMVVGFGGSLGHGLPSLYKTPYDLHQLIRLDYRSNVDDAEVHGERFTGVSDVSVLDGFALAIRRSYLDRIGGFSWMGCDFFTYDYAICAMARRLLLRVVAIGVRCHHRGGGTSVGQSVKDITSQAEYDKSHRWFYEEFRDALPARVR